VHNRIDHDEYKRWLDQAKYTLQSARRDLGAADFTWSCFKAQQAAEYAAKSILRGLGRLASGHSVLKLVAEIEQCGFDVGKDLHKIAMILDRHYIPPRYPDAYPSGSPFEFYDEDTAVQALRAAEKLVRFAREVFKNKNE